MIWTILSPVARISFPTWWKKGPGWAKVQHGFKNSTTLAGQKRSSVGVPGEWRDETQTLGQVESLDSSPLLAPTSWAPRHLLSLAKVNMSISSTARTPSDDTIHLQHHATSREHSQRAPSNKTLHLLPVFSCYTLLFAAGEMLRSLDTFSVREERCGRGSWSTCLLLPLTHLGKPFNFFMPLLNHL